MKKYSVYNLKVVKVETSTNTRYLICRYNNLTKEYIEVLTGEKIEVKNNENVEPLSNYYSVLGLHCYGMPGSISGLTKKDILSKYLEINSEVEKMEIEEILEDNFKGTKLINNILEKATMNFFPSSGVWYSSCFNRPNELAMCYLPCHLRDDEWLAKILRKEQKLFCISYDSILDFVKNSSFFSEKRHEYELEIVKWQIEWILNNGENWICDENYGGDFVYISPVVDLGIRKGIVDTLSAIGMNKNIIEEGIEKYANLWREHCMERAFSNEYEPIYIEFGNVFCETEQTKKKEELEQVDTDFKEKWLKLRRYEYYQNHKNSVDTYGTIHPDMLMNNEEVIKLKSYLQEKHIERKAIIDNFLQNGSYFQAKPYTKNRNLKKQP